MGVRVLVIPVTQSNSIPLANALIVSQRIYVARQFDAHWKSEKRQARKPIALTSPSSSSNIPSTPPVRPPAARELGSARPASRRTHPYAFSSIGLPAPSDAVHGEYRADAMWHSPA